MYVTYVFGIIKIFYNLSSDKLLSKSFFNISCTQHSSNAFIPWNTALTGHLIYHRNGVLLKDIGYVALYKNHNIICIQQNGYFISTVIKNSSNLLYVKDLQQYK